MNIKGICTECGGYHAPDEWHMALPPAIEEPNASAWIEQVLLPEMDRLQEESSVNKCTAGTIFSAAYNEIKQFILSHRDEWKGK